MFIYYEPRLIIKANTKKDCVPIIKEFAKSSKDEILIEFANTVTEATIGRLTFHAEIIETYNDIIFHTYKNKRDGLICHLSYSFSGTEHITAPEEIIRQYTYFKRKEKINKFLNE
jgi:hypothetical protein